MKKIEKIRKRHSRVINFDSDKIAEAIWKAAKTINGKDRTLSIKLAGQIVETL